MADFFQWWQAADVATKATVIGTTVAIVALLWAVVSYFWPRGRIQKGKEVIAKRGSVAAGGDMTGNTISIGKLVDKR